MRKFIGFFITSVLALTSSVLSLSGCNTANFYVKTPTGSSIGEITNGEGAGEIGLDAGFEMKYNAGLVDNTEGE